MLLYAYITFIPSFISLYLGCFLLGAIVVDCAMCTDSISSLWFDFFWIHSRHHLCFPLQLQCMTSRGHAVPQWSAVPLFLISPPAGWCLCVTGAVSGFRALCGCWNRFDREKSILYLLTLYQYSIVLLNLLSQGLQFCIYLKHHPLLEINDLEILPHCARCLLVLLTFETRVLLSPLCGLHLHWKFNLNIF